MQRYLILVVYIYHSFNSIQKVFIVTQIMYIQETQRKAWYSVIHIHI